MHSVHSAHPAHSSAASHHPSLSHDSAHLRFPSPFPQDNYIYHGPDEDPDDRYPDPPAAQDASTSTLVDRSRPARSRRDKPRIALAPDQPPTTQGKQRTRVFVACVQCRGRKIRCDGAKPACYTCTQRLGGEPCSYDPTPKRRGPDRVQGARTRTARQKGPDGEPTKPARRRRRVTTETATSTSQLDSEPLRQSGSDSSLSPEALSPITPTSSQDPFACLSRPVPLRLDLGIILPVEQPGSHLRFPPTSYDHVLYDDLMSPAIRQQHSHIHPVHTTHIVSPQTFYSNTNSNAYIVPSNGEEHEHENDHHLVAEPSVQFNRKVWWDHLLGIYAHALPNPSMSTYHCAPGMGTLTLTQTQRELATHHIVEDLRFLFRISSYWFSFFNVPRFYSNFLDPTRRTRIQPSLILAVLAVSTFLQSSEIGRAEEGRRMALRLRDEAQSTLEASLNARAVDEEVAQAAWILAFFEICCHPLHQTCRVSAALNILDGILRTLALTYLDVDNPQASGYARHAVPSVSPIQPAYSSTQNYYGTGVNNPPAQSHHPFSQMTFSPAHTLAHHPLTSDAHARPPATECGCDSLSLGRVHPDAAEQTPLWVATPAWNYEWTEGDIRKEECRRLCWSATMLAAGYSSYFAAIGGKPLDLFIIDPANFNLLFPGESLMMWTHPYGYVEGGPASSPGKESVWALYLRAMLLWHSCLRLRNDAHVPENEKADFAMRAWLESEAIEDSLNRHKCGIERAFLFYGREYLFNTRMCISFEFQRFIPHVFAGGRKKSEEWLREQGRRAQLAISGLPALSGMAKHSLAYRPQFVWWWMGQVSRALKLWSLDNSLTIALDVCQAFFHPIDYLTKLYPCEEQRKRYDGLREQLRLACRAAEASVGYVPRQL
ncbi:hypothetical protein OF83DRAFT_1054671 [Amylostereum chailletii]|nr:hypothetical protein OF83DRAFT_1054671 [Amylostereum chailletii]